MITKIRFLRSIGKFYNYSAKGGGLDWHKNTFVIAPNAYGKSTLVDVLRSVRDDDPNVIRARRTLGSNTSPEAVIVIDSKNHVFNGTKWDRTHPAIRIFDVPFIHTNVFSHEIEHEHRKNIHRIIVGAQGIKLAEELAVLKTNEKTKRRQFEELGTQFKAAGFARHTLGDLLAIPASEEAAVVGRIHKLEQDIKLKETETQVRALDSPRAVSAPAFDLSAARALAGQELAAAHEAAETSVVAHIDKNIKQTGQAHEFIRQGLDLVHADCPFCGQSLKDAADLLGAYREFFDDAFRTHQRDLEENAEAFANWNLENDLTTLVSSHNANTAALKQWGPFIGVETLPDVSAFVETARSKITALKAKVQTELQKKQKDPNASVDLPQFEALSEELASLEANVDSYNAGLTAFTDKAKAYVANLPKSDVDSIRRVLVKEREIEERFKPEWKKWATDYPAAKKDASDLLAEKDAKQKELEDYSKTIFDTYQERINQLLLTLGADFEIRDLTGKTDARANESYTDFGFVILKKKVPLTVRRDDAPCFKNTLSEGDKGTLAFAFFVASLEKTLDLDKQIVIFDDPLSSLDEARREATARVLLDLSPKLNQLCVFTHKKDFLRMLFDKIPSNTVLQVCSDKKNGSSLRAFDVEEDRKGEHAHLIEDLERYVDEDFGPTSDTMQGSIRKAFEIVLKTKYYRTLAGDITAKKGLGKLLATLSAAGLLDGALEPRLFNLCGVTNDPHHGGIVDAPSTKLTRGELIPLISEALDLLEKV